MAYEGEKKDLVKVGSLWKRQSKSSGYLYLSGEIEVNGEKVKVMVFPVKPEWKKSDKHPDFEIKVEEGDLGAKKRAKGGGYAKAAPAKPAGDDLSEFGI